MSDRGARQVRDNGGPPGFPRSGADVRATGGRTGRRARGRRVAVPEPWRPEAAPGRDGRNGS